MGILEKIMQVFKPKGKVFRRSLITLLLVASLPTLAIGISSYYIGVHQIETEVRHTHNNQFQSVLKEIDKKLEQLELIIGRESFSPVYPAELRNLDSRKHFEYINNIYKSLLVMKDLSPSIKDISVYFSQPGICLSFEKGYVAVSNDGEKNRYDSLLAQKNGIAWINEPIAHRSPAGESESAISLVSKIPGYSTEPYGIIIIEVDIEEVINPIHSLIGNENGVALLIDDNRKLIISEEKQKGTVESLQEVVEERPADAASGNDSFIYGRDGIKYSVACGTLDATGWVLVAGTPLNQLTKPVSNTARLIILASSIGFIAAILLALLGSIRVWRPIDKLFKYIFSQTEEAFCGDEVKYIESKWQQLVSERHSLKERLEKNYPVLRHGFFLQLVQGNLASLDEIALREQIRHFGWDVSGRSFLMLGVQLSKSAGCKEKFKEGDEQLITFAASNIVEEIMAGNGAQAHVINLQNMMIGIMIFFEDSIPVNQVREEVQALCEEIIRCLIEYIGFHTTVCVGRLSKSLAGVNKEFKEICRALKFRDINKDTQIIDTESESVKAEAAMRFPVHIQKETAQALKMGAGNEAARLINTFYDEIKQSIGKEYLVKQSMIQFLGYIQYELLCSGVDIYSIYEENLFEQLFHINEPEQIGKWFHSKVVEPYMAYFGRTQSIAMKRLVENVIQTIEGHYQTDISLEWCADLHHTYPQKLSANFKAVTGLNFIDYLNEYRIGKSKELLKYTSKDISEIARCVGYQATYFNRIFKKYEGITPGAFRERNRGAVIPDISDWQVDGYK